MDNGGYVIMHVNLEYEQDTETSERFILLRRHRTLHVCSILAVICPWTDFMQLVKASRLNAI